MKNYNALDNTDKSMISAGLSQCIEELGMKAQAYPEAVANYCYYALQRHKTWGRNATLKQKKVAYSFWKHRCAKCKEPLAFEDAVFHHKERGIQGQHSPQNLFPQCESCHDQEHAISKGSLSKGSP